MLQNIYMAPYAGLYLDGEKTASEVDLSVISTALVSGDPEKIAGILSEEDQAFWSLSDRTFEKMAAGEVLTEADVEKLAEAEIAALTLLGPDAPMKIAAYTEFYDSVAGYELLARQMARQAWGEAEKRAAELDDNVPDEPDLEVDEGAEPKVALAGMEIPDDREGRLELLKRAQAVLSARHQE